MDHIEKTIRRHTVFYHFLGYGDGERSEQVLWYGYWYGSGATGRADLGLGWRLDLSQTFSKSQ